MLEIKHTDIKNVFDILISGLDKAQGIISELADILTETSRTKNQREKKKWNRISKKCGTITKWITY